MSAEGAVATTAKEQFDRQAEHYNKRWATWSDETLRRMLEWADPQPNYRVLDVATGTGFTALAFAPHVAHVTGADISPGMLAQAAKRAEEQGIANVDWVECPAEKLPFADNTFCLVTVRIAPHHFTDVDAFLREVKRVLKPRGMFLVGDTTVPDDEPEAAAWQNAVEKARDGSHVANLSPREWEQKTEAAGLTVTNVEHRRGAIPIPLESWLETSGTTGARAEVVRRMFAEASPASRREYEIRRDENGAVHFAWQRVLLRAVKPEDGGAATTA